MNSTMVPEPHRIILDRPYWYAFVAAVSVTLTLWAIYLDPVINVGGIDVVRGAQHFLQGQWVAGFGVAQAPAYSALIALLSLATGLSVGHAAYALSVCFQALLTMGFIALVVALGGGRPARLLAALIILAYPTLNELRSHVTSDIAYWACFIWALAWFMRYARKPDRRSLCVCLAASVSAVLFGLEALMVLLSVPSWWLARNAGKGSGRLLKIPAFTFAAGLIVCYALWQVAWQSGVPAGQLLRHPLNFLAGGWHEVGQALDFKVDELRTDFLDEHSQKYGDTALLMTVIWMSVLALARAMGFVYFGITVYALSTMKNFSSRGVLYWWSVAVVMGVALLVTKVIAGFSVDTADAMTLALILLAIVPLALECLRDAGSDTRGAMRWVWPAVLVLVLVTGIKGMDLHTDQYHLREAGLWFRENTEAGDSLYSNNPIIVYYSGLEGRWRAADYSWRKAMNKVQRDEWRTYDYLAAEIPRSKPYREAILMRYLDIKPVRVFSGDGGLVLIFKTEYGHER